MVDSVTIQASDLKQTGSRCLVDMEVVSGRIVVADDTGYRLELDSKSLQANWKKPKAVFQTCSECKKKIEACYRILKKETLEVVFIKCSCGHFPWVLFGGEVVSRLKTQFDSTETSDESADQPYNRSVWSTSTALLYCEKTSRLVVEYQWKDLEAGQFDKHSVKLSGINSKSKTADILVENKTITHLLRDGSFIVKGSSQRIKGTL